MFSIDHILVPVDFSAQSVGALRYARLLAGHFQSEVTFLYVLEPPAYALGPMEFGGILESDVDKLRQAAAEKQLQSFMVQEFSGMPVRRLVHVGDPALNIVELAHAERISLIVMPTRGYGPVDLGPQSPHALKWANQFTSSFGIGLTVTHVALTLPPSGAYMNARRSEGNSAPIRSTPSSKLTSVALASIGLVP